jgi:serine protease inhibitor
VDTDFVKQAVAVLTNTVYFKGAWRLPFDKELTKDKPFHPASDEPKNVPMMLQKHVDYQVRGTNYQWMQLRYKDTSFVMTLVLPDEGTTPEALLASWEMKEWAGFAKPKPASGTAELELPRFTLDYDASLKEALSDLGLANVFKVGEADLKRMEASGTLFLSEVKHVTRLEVNEYGTEAAAATSIGVALVMDMSPPPRITFDRPFVVLLQDTMTELVLFCGIVNTI